MFLLFSLFTNVFAAATDCASKPTFFGLVPWYQYLTIKNDSGPNGSFCDVTFNPLGANSGILLVALAVIDDLMRIAGLVAVGFVIWGGIKYMTSQGSPDGTKQAQQTIINALIGLVLALISVALVSFIGTRIAD